MRNRNIKEMVFIFFLAYFVLLSLSTLGAQTVIRILNGYVLFDSAEGIGKVNDEIVVQRRTIQGVVETGRIRLMLFRENKASGKIIHETGTYPVEVGDFVRAPVPLDPEQVKPASDMPLAGKDTVSNARAEEGERPVIRVVPGYALVDPGPNRWEKDVVLKIRRWTDGGLAEVGEVKILKYENGKAAVKIVREIEPYQIVVGDFVEQMKFEPDIDTYFFDAFRTSK